MLVVVTSIDGVRAEEGDCEEQKTCEERQVGVRLAGCSAAPAVSPAAAPAAAASAAASSCAAAGIDGSGAAAHAGG